MFKREKRMHSFIIRAQEILADGKKRRIGKDGHSGVTVLLQ